MRAFSQAYDNFVDIVLFSTLSQKKEGTMVNPRPEWGGLTSVKTFIYL